MLRTLLVLTLSVVLVPVQEARAERGNGSQLPADWKLLPGYPEGSHGLTVVAGGALVSQGDTALYRSDDAGSSWQALPNPPDGRAMWVDPVDGRVLYGTAATGLSRSADGGLTWSLIRPAPTGPPAESAPMVIDPADHRELFLAERETILRSVDAGATWQTIYTISHAGSPCVAALTTLVPHPTDPARLVTDAGCYAGRSFGTALIQTRDTGRTWSTLFPDSRALLPRRLAGGQGIQSSRLYLIGDAFMGIGGGSVLRSDDDGATWSVILRAEDTAPALGGLAYDPRQPDNVWVATGQTSDPEVTGVRASRDAGQTWTYLGRRDLGWVNDLVLAPLADDGSALLAATNEGIWWYPINGTETPVP